MQNKSRNLYVISLQEEFVASNATLGDLLHVDVRLVVDGAELAAQKGEVGGGGGHHVFQVRPKLYSFIQQVTCRI